jgi:hypothetical protein
MPNDGSRGFSPHGKCLAVFLNIRTGDIGFDCGDTGLRYISGEFCKFLGSGCGNAYNKRRRELREIRKRLFKKVSDALLVAKDCPREARV